MSFQSKIGRGYLGMNATVNEFFWSSRKVGRLWLSHREIFLCIMLVIECKFPLIGNFGPGLVER